MKNTILRILIIAVLFSLVSGIVVSIAGLFLGWKTSTQFSDGFFYTGAVMISIGVLNILGGHNQPTSGLMTNESVNHSDRDDVDIVVLGCPHAGLDRIRTIAGMLEGKKIHPNTRLYVTTCHPIKNTADKQGYTEIITRAGGELWEDACGLVLAVDPSTVFACDSAKMANYLPGETGSKNTWFGTTEECIQAALRGR